MQEEGVFTSSGDTFGSPDVEDCACLRDISKAIRRRSHKVKLGYRRGNGQRDDAKL